MYKAIFSDMDSTLLTDNLEICKRNIEAIKAAQKKGVKFLLCTGRLPFGYEMYKDELDLSNAVSSNGAIIYSNGELINECTLSKDNALTIVNYAIKYHECLRIFAIDFLYLLNTTRKSIYKNHAYVKEEEALKVVNEQKIYKLAFQTDHEHLVEVKKDIEAMNLNVNLFFSDPEFLEIILKGESKGEGIVKYCKYNNIDLKDTIGVGDEDNDLPMFEKVGLSCCPANSKQSIKDVCDYVTKADNNEGAIADIIEKFIINE